MKYYMVKVTNKNNEQVVVYVMATSAYSARRKAEKEINGQQVVSTLQDRVLIFLL